MKSTISKLFGSGTTPAAIENQIVKARARKAELEQSLAAAKAELESAIAGRREVLLGDSEPAALRKSEQAVFQATSRRDGFSDALEHLGRQIGDLEVALAAAKDQEAREKAADEIDRRLEAMAAAAAAMEKAAAPFAAAAARFAEAADPKAFGLKFADGTPANADTLMQMAASEALARARPALIDTFMAGPAATGMALHCWHLRGERLTRTLPTEPWQQKADRDLGDLGSLVVMLRKRAAEIRAGQMPIVDPSPKKVIALRPETGDAA